MTIALYLLTLCLPLGTILLIFGMRYVSAVLQARARLANDGAYRQIAEKAVTADMSRDRDRADLHPGGAGRRQDPPDRHREDPEGCPGDRRGDTSR